MHQKWVGLRWPVTQARPRFMAGQPTAMHPFVLSLSPKSGAVRTFVVNYQQIAKSRLVWILPVTLGAITLFLWFWSLAEYRALMHSTSVDGFTPMWTDYTPFPLILAGGLNAPIATFASPMYALLPSDESNVKRVLLFVGVILLWSYVGWTWDQPRRGRIVATKSRVVAIFGVLFGIFIVYVSIPMYHVGIFYKAVACLWALSICRHFIRYWRGPAGTVIQSG